MKKSKAKKIISVLQGMSPEQQKSWMVQNRYIESDTDQAFNAAYQAILFDSEQ